MEKHNKELLDEVTKKYLEAALESDANSEEGAAAFKQAMAAVDRQVEVTKIEAASKEQEQKQQLAEAELAAKKEMAKEDRTQNKWLKILEIGATAVIVTVVRAVCDHVSNDRYMEKICNFEKDYTFTTTPGKATSRMFKFGK